MNLFVIVTKSNRTDNLLFRSYNFGLIFTFWEDIKLKQELYENKIELIDFYLIYTTDK